MSLFGLFSKPAPELRAVIDVGPQEIKAVIFEVSPGSKLPKKIKKIILTLPYSFNAVRAVVRFRELLFVMVKELGRVPSKITVAFAPPWAEYSLATWTISHKTGLKIASPKELGRYFQNMLDNNRDSKKALIAYPLQILANKYAVSPDTLFRSGNILVNELSFLVLLLYFSPEVGAILSEAKESLGGLPLEFVPLIAAEKEALIKALGTQDTLLVDIGRETTTLSLIKAGDMAGVSVFPMGARHFLRGLAKLGGVSWEEAEDQKRQYQEGLLSEAQKIKMHSFLVGEAELWKKMFLEELDSFYHIGPLPSLLLLLGEGAGLPEVGAALRDKEWIKNVSYSETPEVKILQAPSLFEGNSLQGLLRGPEDIGLASLIFYSMYHEPLF